MIKKLENLIVGYIITRQCKDGKPPARPAAVLHSRLQRHPRPKRVQPQPSAPNERRIRYGRRQQSDPGGQFTSQLAQRGALPAYGCGRACGFQNSATALDLGFCDGSLVFVDEAADDSPALDPLLGERRDGRAGVGGVSGCDEGVVRCGALVVGQDEPQMSFAKISIRSVTSVSAVSTNLSA
jgi:hypothetical protein